jgi:hypothetical protein
LFSAVVLLLGIGYLAIGAVRAVSMVVDRRRQSNVISLAIEIVLGVILVL